MKTDEKMGNLVAEHLRLKSKETPMVNIYGELTESLKKESISKT